MKKPDLHTVKFLLESRGQAHLLKYWDELPLSDRDTLLAQISEIDFSLISTLAGSLLKQDVFEIDESALAPLDAPHANSFSESERLALVQTGLQAIKNGQAAAFLVAGGMGTRLGYDGPKGAYNIGLPSGKVLFHLMAQRLKALSEEAGGIIPWYIMTSEANHDKTLACFEEHGFFGLVRSDVFFFQQPMFPAVSPTGKIMLETKGSIARSPNGNGGCFSALETSGALADMEQRGVEYLFFHVVDNALIKMVDPLFLGHVITSGAPIGSKASARASAEEKVGLLVNYQGRPRIIEYSDMPAHLLSRRNGDGQLTFNEGNIAIHMFRRSFLQKHAKTPLPFHRAHKKIKTLDAAGNPFQPSEPNGYKFELFMFDLFPLAESMSTLSVNREEEFAPVKNAAGVDSPETARELLQRQYKITGRSDLI